LVVFPSGVITLPVVASFSAGAVLVAVVTFEELEPETALSATDDEGLGELLFDN